MTQELNLDDLLAQQEALAKKIADARKLKKDEAIRDVVAIIKKYAITVKDLSGAFGYEVPELTTRTKQTRGPATPKYTYTVDGVVYNWAGRGAKLPKTLLTFLETNKITVEQFKADSQYAYKGE